MKKHITCTLLLILSLCLNVKKVYAITGIAGFDGGAYSTGITWRETGDGTGASGEYTDHIKHLKINGQKFVAYCLDPGLKLNTGDEYSCSPLTDAGAYSLVTNGGNYTTTQMSLRFYAVFKGYGSSSLTQMRAAMIRFAQVKDGMQMNQLCETMKSEGKINHTCSGNPYDYLSGNQGLVDAGYQLAWEAREATKRETSGSGGLTFTKTAASTKNQITYNVTSLQNINKIKFVCEGCTIVGSDKNFSGRSGTLVVRPPADCEPFKIKAYYVPNGIQLCTSLNGSINERQMLVVNFEATSSLSPGSTEIDTSGEPNDVFEDRGIDCDPECCTEVDIKPNYIEGEINNCCLDNTHSWAKEYDLNQLVCYSKDLLVDHYWKMCNSESYLDKKMNGELNEYCDIYCTERVTVDVPGAITATSGRYFDLTTTSQGTKSPYVEGFKRCRTLIHFKKWQDDYRKQVEEQVRQYNKYQEERLWDLIYEDALADTKSCNLTITITCQGESKSGDKHDDPKDTSKVTCHYDLDTTSHSKETKFGTITYTQYNFTNPDHNHKKAYFVKLDEKGFKSDADGYYNYYKVLKDTNKTLDHAIKSIWETTPTITEANNFMSQEQAVTSSACGETAGVSCSKNFDDTCGNSEGDHGTYQENVVSVHATHHGAAASAKGAYAAAVVNAKTLEEKIDKCDKYFTEYEGTNAESNFPFRSLFFGFEYSQVYVDNYGELKKDVILVPFESEPGCQISGPTLGPDAEDGMVAPQYSTKYYSDKETETEDFGKTGIEWEEFETGFEQYIDELYKADQKFVQDAKYKATCSWNEPTNTKYTLVQKGIVQEGDFNITKNDRQYAVHLTTLDGTYDTRWLLSGLGTNSKFDAFFAENGAVCSNKQSASSDGLFHCALHVEHEIIFTGKCNGEKTTTQTEECEKNDGTDTVMNFKIVDPATVFTCDSLESCGYGYNWFKMNGGPETLEEIRRKGKEDKTYAPESLTYQVKLTSKDMREIKNYNAYRENNNYGGYSDFSLICDCPDDNEECNEVGGTQTCKRSRSCRKCRSIFLNNLYDGHISYSGNHSVTKATGNIESIRNSGRVHWAG